MRIVQNTSRISKRIVLFSAEDSVARGYRRALKDWYLNRPTLFTWRLSVSFTTSELVGNPKTKAFWWYQVRKPSRGIVCSILYLFQMVYWSTIFIPLKICVSTFGIGLSWVFTRSLCIAIASAKAHCPPICAVMDGLSNGP